MAHLDDFVCDICKIAALAEHWYTNGIYPSMWLQLTNLDGIKLYVGDKTEKLLDQNLKVAITQKVLKVDLVFVHCTSSQCPLPICKKV